MDYSIIIIFILGILLNLAGLIGCFVPTIPGPPLNFISLLLIQLFLENKFHNEIFLIYLGATLFIYGIDYVLPLWGAKKYGMSKYGIWGSIIGMLIGIFFFPPFGFFIGLFIGGIFGELLIGKSGTEALKSGAATVIISLIMISVKVIFSFFLFYIFIQKIFE